MEIILTRGGKTKCKKKERRARMFPGLMYVCMSVRLYVCTAASAPEREYGLGGAGEGKKTTALFVDRCLHAYGLLIG